MSGGGRKPFTRAAYYVATYGMSRGAVYRLGGPDYLDSLGEDARNVLLNQFKRFKVKQVLGRRKKAA
jgi:hypothetical protein